MNEITTRTFRARIGGGFLFGTLLGFVFFTIVGPVYLFNEHVDYEWETLVTGFLAIVAAIIGASAIQQSTRRQLAVQQTALLEAKRSELLPKVLALTDAGAAFMLADYSATPEGREKANPFFKISDAADELREILSSLRGSIGPNFDSAISLINIFLLMANDPVDAESWYKFSYETEGFVGDQLKAGRDQLWLVHLWAVKVQRGSKIEDIAPPKFNMTEQFFKLHEDARNS